MAAHSGGLVLSHHGLEGSSLQVDGSPEKLELIVLANKQVLLLQSAFSAIILLSFAFFVDLDYSYLDRSCSF
jgi:hypothetical protein